MGRQRVKNFIFILFIALCAIWALCVSDEISQTILDIKNNINNKVFAGTNDGNFQEI